MRNLNISQEFDIRVDWEKLAKDLKKEFNIVASEDDIEAFCCENEMKYLSIIDYDQEIEDTWSNDLSGDEVDKRFFVR